MTTPALYGTVNDKPLNVMVATPAGGIGRGGIDRMMAALAAELARQPGVAARLVATRGDGPLAFSWFYLARFCAGMTAARLRGRLDVVHINLSRRGSTYRKLVVAGCARMLGVPYVVHLHSGGYRDFWTGDDTAAGRLIRALFANAGRIVVLGTPWHDFIAERVPEARERIVVVPNAVRGPSLPRVDDRGNDGGGGETPVHVLFLGRINERKGVFDLVRALARMKDLPGWRATLAGDGDLGALRAEIAAHGLADRIAVPGWLGAEDTERLLAEGDVLALPSYVENLPMSVIEAMAYGLGVVATPVGAVEDIVRDGETGLLVPPGDDAALAGALTRLVSDGDARKRLGGAAQAFQRAHLSIGPYAERICAVWRDAAALPSAGRKAGGVAAARSGTAGK